MDPEDLWKWSEMYMLKIRFSIIPECYSCSMNKGSKDESGEIFRGASPKIPLAFIFESWFVLCTSKNLNESMHLSPLLSRQNLSSDNYPSASPIP